MFHYSIFSSAEGEIPAHRRFSAVTFFGFSSLKRPTLAQRIQHMRRGGPPKRSIFDKIAGSDRGLILTVFGITEIRTPTVMEEYSALRSLVSGGQLGLEECRALLDRIDTSDDWVGLTLFGGCMTKAVARSKQAKALDAGEKAGLISSEHRRLLDELIGAPAATTAEVLGRLAVAPA